MMPLKFYFSVICFSICYLQVATSKENSIQVFVKEYCIECHNNNKQKGKTNLEGLELNVRDKVWQKVLAAVENYDMPPEDEKQPSDQHREEIVSAIKNLASQTKNPGYVSLRRMTRLEYDNSVRDLLDLSSHIFVLTDRVIREKKPYFDPASGKMPDQVDLISRTTQRGIENPNFAGVSSLPIDNKAEHGYENNAHTTTLSPLLMEKYLSVATSLLNSPSFPQKSGLYQALFSDPEGEIETEVTKRLSPLIKKAFRKQVTKQQISKYTNFFLQHLQQSNSFTETMKATVSAILSSPDFLFVNKLEYTSNQPEVLSAYELASRLALFLWGSLPDQELFAVAESGELLKDHVLEQQVKRMLKDKRIRYLSYSFAMQWLNLKQMMSVSPDFAKFDNFYFDKRYRQRHIGQFAIVEPVLLFETILIEDRAILEFLDTNYSYLNQAMKDWYGLGTKKIGDNKDTVWSRESLPNRQRGGVITSSAFLSMTSTPSRSSPINRGAWISSVLFNSPPPPPPADVPPLDEKAKDENFKTIRDRFEAHRKNPNCASCHNKIDPLGFSLENYNAVGQWREKYSNELPIDTSGTYNKFAFKDVVTFKDMLMSQKERFTKAFIKHLMSFGLNREIELHDQDSIDQIAKDVTQKQHKFSEVILGIVKSYPFRNKVQKHQ